jgi:hypothetical protein
MNFFPNYFGITHFFSYFNFKFYFLSKISECLFLHIPCKTCPIIHRICNYVAWQIIKTCNMKVSSICATKDLESQGLSGLVAKVPVVGTSILKSHRPHLLTLTYDMSLVAPSVPIIY